MLCITYVSGDIGGSVLGALTEELGVDDDVFGMRFLPCMSVWSLMAAFYGVCGFDMRWKIFEHH